MYDFISVVKFNNEYFEDGDIVAVTLEDGTVTVGSIIIRQKNEFSIHTSCNYLALDISEKYHQKEIEFNTNKIKIIQKVKQ